MDEISRLAVENFSPAAGTLGFPCPKCSDGRRAGNRRRKPLRITFEEDGCVWFCHNCEAKGQMKMSPQIKPTNQERGGLRVVPEFRRIDDHLETISDLRGFDLKSLSDEVQSQLVYSDEVYYGSHGSKLASIGFRYDGDAIKWRSIDGKHFSWSGSARSLFPSSAIGKDETIYLVEGEYDALAMRSAGYAALSPPNGASLSSAGDTPEYLKPLISGVRDGEIRVVIAVDADDRGNECRSALLSFLGRKNVGYIDWSEFGVKDANECIIKHGVDGLIDAVASVHEVLFDGIVRARSVTSSIDKIRTGGFKQGAKVGIASIDKLLTICSDQISVVTGVPGSGKSELLDAFMVRLAVQEDWKFAIFSAENPIDIHAGKLLEKHVGLPIFEGRNRMSNKQLLKSSEWLDQHFFFLDPSSGNSIKSILGRAAILVEHKKINGLVIDPFNYTDVDLDTNSISVMLTELHAFAAKHHIHIFIVAHPQKMYRGEGGKLPTPTGMDVSGSASWYAKCDFGLTVERLEENETRLVVWKCRFKWLGDTGSAYLRYDPTCGRYDEGQSAEEIASGLVWEDPLEEKNTGEDSGNQEDFRFSL